MSTWPTLKDGLSVVIVSDVRDVEVPTPIELRADLEMTDPATLASLIQACRDLGVRTTVCSGPTELGENAESFEGSTVLSIYGGSDSRNRMALVPAICEAHHLDFIGPDAYGRIICQDKRISTTLASEAGFLTPKQQLFHSFDDENQLSKYDPPYVLKPLLEGSSIGITRRNLIRNKSDGIQLLSDLFARFKQPVLLEEFIPGREVSLNFIECPNGTIWSFTEICIPHEPLYFDTNLFDATEKIHHHTDRRVVSIDSELPKGLLEKATRLLQTVGVIGYGRIDGKFNDGRFTFLELTPDAWLGPTGAFAAGFMNNGKCYAEIIAATLMSNRAIPSYPTAND
ncbi:MAG: D-alanine--D-alanine ligase [Pseudomonadota bacterium]